MLKYCYYAEMSKMFAHLPYVSEVAGRLVDVFDFIKIKTLLRSS
jgi:hypothetical protein